MREFRIGMVVADQTVFVEDKCDEDCAIDAARANPSGFKAVPGGVQYVLEEVKFLPEPGDVVRLVTGGPKMTVMSIKLDEKLAKIKVYCSWFIGNDLHNFSGEPDCFELVE